MFSALASLWRAWGRVARRLADFQARVLLTLFYFFIATPFALIVRFAADPLRLKPTTAKGWCGRGEPPADPLRQAQQQS